MDGLRSSRFDLRHATTDHPTFVTAAERRVFAIDGAGSFVAADFRLATVTLHDIARRLASMVPNDPHDARAAPILECAWWWPSDEPPDRFIRGVADRAGWRWRQFVEIDQRADDDTAGSAISATAHRAGRDAPLVRVAAFDEGRAAQILHLGGRSTAGPLVLRLWEAIEAEGATPGAYLHELILADEADVPADRARMILRLPIAPPPRG